MADPLIRYACRNAAHQQAVIELTPSDPVSPITLYEREWAYCPSGARDGHRWESIAGTSIQDIRVRLARVQRAGA